MDDRQIDRAREGAAQTGRRMADSAQDVAERAGAHMQARMSRISDRAQEVAEGANARVAELTGRPIESWAAETRRYVRDHPLGSVMIAIGLGYVVGKLLTRD